MRRILIGAAIIAVALALWAGAYFTLNGDAVASPGDGVTRQVEAPAAPDALNLTVWNLGYGGLGRESDFVADGGTHMFPPSRAAVRANVDAIDALVGEDEADVFIFQEIAYGGPVNYWVNLKGALDRTLADRSSVFFADFRTRLMPWPLRMEHGQAIYSRFGVESADVVPLPAEDTAIFGVKRRYASVVARMPIEGSEHGWTIASVHLAAFDPDAAVRTRQLRELLAWAQREYESGQHVVLAGDWNFQIAETNFPNTTEERFLFWLFPFPQDALPEGWRIGADASVPSVRTNYQPYVAGENYVTTIDGLIVSPNVEIESVAGVDLGFEHTDHQPVRARVRALP
ncbi:MAG TPA: endonuclease/exonuclease/phosphatase family protein [Vitreimonas sp.]|nr:endonuclease/exonuclease/phosphatase family protein [Vitreimonas sp.]